MNSEKYIGLDVHQATVVVAVTDSTGKLVEASQKGGGPQGQSSRPTNANLVVDPWVSPFPETTEFPEPNLVTTMTVQDRGVTRPRASHSMIQNDLQRQEPRYG